MDLQRKDILRMLEERSNEIRAFGVKKLGLFGSAARNDSPEVNDLDFVVELEQKSFDSYMELKSRD